MICTRATSTRVTASATHTTNSPAFHLTRYFFFFFFHLTNFLKFLPFIAANVLFSFLLGPSFLLCVCARARVCVCVCNQYVWFVCPPSFFFQNKGSHFQRTCHRASGFVFLMRVTFICICWLNRFPRAIFRAACVQLLHARARKCKCAPQRQSSGEASVPPPPLPRGRIA